MKSKYKSKKTENRFKSNHLDEQMLEVLRCIRGVEGVEIVASRPSEIIFSDGVARMEGDEGFVTVFFGVACVPSIVVGVMSALGNITGVTFSGTPVLIMEGEDGSVEVLFGNAAVVTFADAVVNGVCDDCLAELRHDDARKVS